MHGLAAAGIRRCTMHQLQRHGAAGTCQRPEAGGLTLCGQNRPPAVRSRRRYGGGPRRAQGLPAEGLRGSIRLRWGHPSNGCRRRRYGRQRGLPTASRTLQAQLDLIRTLASPCPAHRGPSTRTCCSVRRQCSPMRLQRHRRGCGRWRCSAQGGCAQQQDGCRGECECRFGVHGVPSKGRSQRLGACFTPWFVGPCATGPPLGSRVSRGRPNFSGESVLLTAMGDAGMGVRPEPWD